MIKVLQYDLSSGFISLVKARREKLQYHEPVTDVIFPRLFVMLFYNAPPMLKKNDPMLAGLKTGRK